MGYEIMLPDYNGYESLDSFAPGGLATYRELLLEKTKPQVDFIRKHVWTPLQRQLDVVELGSGNGRLFVGLHQQGLLERGLGFELSKSRVYFAKMWANHTETPVWYVQKDVSGMKISDGYKRDLVVCITGCFQYFYPLSPEAPSSVLALMRGFARQSLFELYRKPRMGRTWHKLPEEDPWEYLLDEYEDVGDWVRHTKTFLKSNGEKDVRVENLAYYKMEVLLKHLERAGFKNVHWAKQNSTTMVVLVS